MAEISSPTEHAEAVPISVPSDQAKAYGKIVDHIFGARIRELQHHVRLLKPTPDTASFVAQIQTGFERIPTMVTSFQTAKEVTLRRIQGHADNPPDYAAVFSDERDYAIAPAGTVTIEMPLVHQLFKAVEDRFANALAVVNLHAQVLDDTTIMDTAAFMKRQLQEFGTQEGIRVVTDAEGKREFWMKKKGEDYVLVPLQAVHAKDSEALAEKWKKQEADKKEVPLPKEISFAFAKWMSKHLETIADFPMDNADMQQGLEDMQKKIAELESASEVKLVSLSDDNHGWQFETTQGEKVVPSSQTITLFRPAATQFVRAVTNTFSNPLSLIKGHAETYGMSELNGKATAIEQEIKRISQNDADLDFEIADDGSVSIVPR